MADAGPRLDLETLVVKIGAEHQEYMTKMEEVKNQFLAVNALFAGGGTEAGAGLRKNIANTAYQFKGIENSLAGIKKNADVFGVMANTLSKAILPVSLGEGAVNSFDVLLDISQRFALFGSNMKSAGGAGDLSKWGEGLQPVGKSLADFAKTLNDIGPTKNLQEFGQSLNVFMKQIASKEMKTMLASPPNFEPMRKAGRLLKDFNESVFSLDFSHLPQIGHDMSSFSTALGAGFDAGQMSLFFQAFTAIDAKAIQRNVNSLAGINWTGLTDLNNKLIAADLPRLAKTLSTANFGNLTALSTSMAELKNIGRHLQDFNKALVGIDTKMFNAVGSALRAVGSPNLNAVLNSNQFFRLPLIAQPIVDFSDKLKTGVGGLAGIDAKIITPVARVLQAIGSPDLADAMTATGRFKGLSKIGVHITDFADSVKTVDPKVLNPVARVLATFGSKDLFGALLDPDRFATLASIGTHVAAFGTTIAGVDPKSMMSVGRTLSALGGKELLANLADSTKFSTLPAIGGYLATFASSLTGISKIADITPLMKLLDVISSSRFAKLLASPTSLVGLGSIGTQLSAFATQISSGANVPALNAVTNALNAAASARSKLNAAMGGSGGGRGGVGGPGGFFSLPSFGGGGSNNISGMLGSGGWAAGGGFAFQLQMLRYGILGIGTASVIAFSHFDSALTRSAALLGMTAPAMRAQLTSLVRGVASGSPLGPTAMATGVGALRQSGLSAADAMNQLATAERFAVSGAIDMQHSAQTLVGIMHGFHKVPADMERIADVLVYSSSVGGGSIQDLSQAMLTLAPNAQAMGMSIEQVASALIVMNQNGIHGGRAASELQRILGVVEQRAIHNSMAWKNLGIEVYQTGTRSFVGMASLMDQLGARLTGQSELQRRAILGQLGLAEGIGGGATLQQGLNALLGHGAALREYEAGGLGAAGANRVFSDTVKSAFGEQMKILWSNIQLVAGGIGEMLVPTVKLLTLGLYALIGAWNGLPDVIKTTVSWMAPLLLVGLGVSKVFGLLMGIIGVLYGRMLLLGINMTTSFARAMGLLSASGWAAVAPYAILAGKLLIIGAALILIIDLMHNIAGMPSPSDSFLGRIANLTGGSGGGTNAAFSPTQYGMGGGAWLRTSPTTSQSSILRYHAGFLNNYIPNILTWMENNTPNFVGTMRQTNHVPFQNLAGAAQTAANALGGVARSAVAFEQVSLYNAATGMGHLMAEGLSFSYGEGLSQVHDAGTHARLDSIITRIGGQGLG